MTAFSDQNKNYTSELVRLNKYNLLAIGYEKLDVSTAGAKSLTVPAEAKYAEFTLESSVTSGIVVRHLELGDKTLPTATDGLGLTHLVTFDISGYPNLINFRAILATAGTHTLHVEYFK